MSATQSHEILMLEHQYWDAMRSKDVDLAVSLTKFPCTVTGPEGVHRLTEAQYRSMMESMNVDCFKEARIEHPQVDIVNDHMAIITYSTHVNDMKMLDVSTWIKEGEKWVCVYHSENPVQH